jgi:hypothetical protein
MEVGHATRKQAAVILLALFSLSSSLMLLRSSMSHRQRTPDSISPFETRFKEIRTALPPNGIVGYISDREVSYDLDWHDPRNSEAWRESRRVQYALAPVLIDLSSDHQMVVGNFRDQTAVREKLGNSPLVVVREFGDGVLLLNNAASR